MHIHICICLYIHIYKYICTYTVTHAYMYIMYSSFMYECICIYIHIHMHTYVHTYIHTSSSEEPRGLTTRTRSCVAGHIYIDVIAILQQTKWQDSSTHSAGRKTREGKKNTCGEPYTNLLNFFWRYIKASSITWMRRMSQRKLVLLYWQGVRASRPLSCQPCNSSSCHSHSICMCVCSSMYVCMCVRVCVVVCVEA